jgi:predicted P-loop ATPase
MGSSLVQIVSYYKSKESKTSENILIEDIIEIIKFGKGIKEKIELLRSENDKTNKEKIKGSLPMVTFSGTFGESRKSKALLQYSNIICLDIDKLSDVGHAMQLIESDKYTLASFISPSGNGLKVLIQVNGNENDHAYLFNGLQNYYKDIYNIEIDKACKDVSRGAFLSYDPSIYVNSKSKVWGKEDIILNKLEKTNINLSKKIEFKDGNRNQYVFEFANLCKAQKIDINDCITYSKNKFNEVGFQSDEIINTIHSAYANNYNSEITQQFKLENKLSTWDVAEGFIKQKYEIRYNTISNKAEYKILNSSDNFIDINEDSIYRDMQKNNVSFSLNKLRSLLASDFISKYDPLAIYFESLDQIESNHTFDYIDHLASFVKSDDDHWFRTQFKKMMVRSVACALDLNVFNKQVFILVHSMQNSGKSTFCRFLCPPQLSDYFTENISTDKDSLIALANNFIVNMDELATLNRAEINTLKSMISRNNVNVRLPYGRRQVNLPRRANFVGSTNKDEFLTDETGSVRWLCFELTEKIDFDYKVKVNIDLVWKQAYELYKNNFNYELSQDEINFNHQRNMKYESTMLEYDILQDYCMPCEQKLKSNFKTAGQILVDLRNQDKLRAVNLTKPNISKGLKMLGYKIESCYLEEFKQSRKGFFIKYII